MEKQLDEVQAAGRVAALWRWVRWGAAVFCFVQFAVYVPGPAVQVPWPLLLLGSGLAAVTVLINLSAVLLERQRPRATPPHPALPQVASSHAASPGSALPSTAVLQAASPRPARRDLALLGADTTVVVVVVLLFAFEPASAVWVLLVVPVLEAALVGRLRWALVVWAVAVAALLLRETAAVHLHGLPGAGPQELLSSVGFRAGVLLLVATTVGLQAGVAHRQLLQLLAARATLAHEVGHDPLTGLANRRLFLERAGRALHLQEQDRGTVGVLFVDCDSFKAVNDVHGHAVGDEVLRQVAHRLTALAGPHDTPARLGGDEFAVLLHRSTTTHSHDGQDVTGVAAAVQAALAAPYAVAGLGALAMSCSVGAADHRDGDTLSTLLRRADQAMYLHKLTARSPGTNSRGEAASRPGRLQGPAGRAAAEPADRDLHRPVPAPTSP
ncbi:diguanylate cyclase domain-containing protein [Aquipuribacter hungaricus]|uniref:Diguanylate cyclase domain-containing protein n=1 Tax=Aquipuribacter hungaricus TaxID=545624 RepID=A0ABV7WML9_9MICO